MKKIIFLMVLFFLVNNSQILFGGEINTLIKQMKSDDNKERAVAIKNLEKKGAEVIPDLIKALETATTRLKKLQTAATSTELQKEYRYRGDIILFLSRTKDERGIEPIGNILLKSMDKEERLTAAIGLGIVENKKAIPILKQALQDEDTKVGLRAAYSLGRLGDDIGYTLAVEKINDSDNRVREMAIEALGRIGKKEGSVFVEQALNDPDIWVGIKAKVAKKQIAANQLQGQAKTDYLITVMGDDEQYEAQKWAARELFEMGESGINILKQIAKDKENKGAYPAYKELKGRGIILE